MLRGEEKVKVKPYDMADVDIIDAGGPISAIRRVFDFKSNNPKLTQLEEEVFLHFRRLIQTRDIIYGGIQNFEIVAR